ncbi:MAG TPA: hypothetical protein VFS44_07140 [Gemmatimonadaceae bacterium]|nr:hypothetical protein [Gemmatimonadaceae bacterium]
MTVKVPRRSPLAAQSLAALLALGCAASRPAPDSRATPAPPASTAGAAAIEIHDNHELPYAGPVEFSTELPDGAYHGTDAAGIVAGGHARVVVSLPAGGQVALRRDGAAHGDPFAAGPLSLVRHGGAIDLAWKGASLGTLELGLVVIPGTSAGPESVASAFRPLDVRWTPAADGTVHGDATSDGFRVALTLAPYGGGWVDVRARVERVAADSAPAYVALVRRLTLPGGIADARLRFNGRVLDGADSPDTWAKDFAYTRGVDWASWRSGGVRMVATSGFTPAPTVRRDSAWQVGSHLYVWERARRDGDRMWLISEVAGPNRHQKTKGYMPVTPYAPIARGDSVNLSWRLALADAPARGWENAQLLGFAGYRMARRDGAGTVVDIGVPAVEFGVSYFPYSTFTENFDFYRTPGLDRETFWAFSPVLWKHWRELAPRMRTDLHIIRAMGFDWVRLHHLELLQGMPRADALAFLDFYVGEARSLGLKILLDTEGPPEWVSTILGRYPDVVRRYEIENEILIPGIHPGEPERWTSLYRTAHRADPNVQAYLTSAGNDGMFERLRALGVPFDRVGVHVYKHGPEWMEALSSHALADAGYAASLGKGVTLGEFNWKELTRLSPPARRVMVDSVYDAMLAPRAIPEFFLFQFQETMGVNPSIGRSGVRHYEPLMLDRRPKPEALEFMAEIRRYARADAPVRVLPVTIDEATLDADSAVAGFRIVNRTGARQELSLRAEAYGGVESRLATPARVTVAPGDTVRGRLVLRLPAGAAPGTYHHFLAVSYGGGTAWGWGIVSHPGAPTFDPAPVLAGRVSYPQGDSTPARLDWTRPLAVAFGADAPKLEMEMAYMLANTLQAATGKPVWLSSTADLPDSLARRGALVLVGTSASNPMIGPAMASAGAGAGAGSGGTAPAAGTGLVLLRDDARGAQRLVITGADTKGVEAAAMDVLLRYWRQAKDATIRITGLERGAALGNRADVTNPDPP